MDDYDSKDLMLFMSNLPSAIAAVIQYNNDNRGMASNSPFNITGMCSMLMTFAADTNALTALATFTTAYNGINASCMSISYIDYIQEMQNTSAQRSWMWQTCTECDIHNITIKKNHKI